MSKRLGRPLGIGISSITNLKMLTPTTLRTIEVASVNIELLPASLMRSGGIRRDERSKRHFNPSEGQGKRPGQRSAPASENEV